VNVFEAAKIKLRVEFRIFVLQIVGNLHRRKTNAWRKKNNMTIRKDRSCGLCGLCRHMCKGMSIGYRFIYCVKMMRDLGVLRYEARVGIREGCDCWQDAS
jgi:NAD-dependent dihydropyrimidine dehydrogenase PreA subunit